MREKCKKCEELKAKLACLNYQYIYCHEALEQLLRAIEYHLNDAKAEVHKIIFDTKPVDYNYQDWLKMIRKRRRESIEAIKKSDFFGRESEE